MMRCVMPYTWLKRAIASVRVLSQYVQQRFLDQIFGEQAVATGETIEIAKEWAVMARH